MLPPTRLRFNVVPGEVRLELCQSVLADEHRSSFALRVFCVTRTTFGSRQATKRPAKLILGSPCPYSIEVDQPHQIWLSYSVDMFKKFWRIRGGSLSDILDCRRVTSLVILSMGVDIVMRMMTAKDLSHNHVEGVPSLLAISINGLSGCEVIRAKNNAGMAFMICSHSAHIKNATMNSQSPSLVSLIAYLTFGGFLVSLRELLNM